MSGAQAKGYKFIVHHKFYNIDLSIGSWPPQRTLAMDIIRREGSLAEQVASRIEFIDFLSPPGLVIL